MNHKRGSEDYGERRSSFGEMTGSTSGGLVSGWYNKTFKGMQPLAQQTTMQQPATGMQKEPKRGVME